MRKYIVNVVEKRITPFVVEAESEWEAIEKASDGDGYIHQSGSFDLGLDPSSWEVEEDRKSTRLNSSHSQQSRMPSSA